MIGYSRVLPGIACRTQQYLAVKYPPETLHNPQYLTVPRVPQSTAQYPAVPCITLQYPAAPCSTLQYPAVPCSPRQYPTVPGNIPQYPTVPRITPQYPAVPRSTLQIWGLQIGVVAIPPFIKWSADNIKLAFLSVKIV